MALEEELIRRIKLHCTRVFTPSAPYSTPRPYVTWQHIGGRTARFMDGSNASLRNAFVQVNVWDDTNMSALALIKAIDNELCAVGNPKFVCEGMEEPADAYIEGDEGQDPGEVKGLMQSFRIWGER